MNPLKYLIIIFAIFYSTFCQIDTETKEFEENEINSDFQQFIFKTSKPSKIILIIKNENLNQNSNDTKALTTFNKVNKKIEEFNLYYTIGNVILEEEDQTEENVEYILKFKNYGGGKFIIYNSANDFPLKDLEKGYNLKYYFPTTGRRDVKLTFYTKILENDALLDIYPGEKIKIIKILEPDVEGPLEIKNNSAYLPKDSKYKIEFKENGIYGFGVAIKKREIINYKINDEIKLDLFLGIPYFFLLKVSEFDTDMIYTFMYCASYTWYNISIFELDSDRVDNWDNIKFNEEKRLYSGYINEINTTKLAKEYLLIKYALSSTSISYANHHYFYKFKIFQSFQSSTPSVIDKIEKPKLIIQKKDYRYLMFTSSNISNLHSFEDNETKNFIIKGLSEYFSYIISPTSEPSKLNYFTIKDHHFKWNIYYKEKCFRSDLNSLFDYLDDKSIWNFDINDSYTFIIKSYFGFPKIYYINEMTEDNIENLRNERFDNFTQINTTNNIMNFNSSFALYIEPYENTYLNMLLNKDDNLNILKETPNKYLIANKEYQLLAPNKLMVRIDEDVDSNINILENEKIISALNKENIFFIIEFKLEIFIN